MSSWHAPGEPATGTRVAADTSPPVLPPVLRATLRTAYLDLHLDLAGGERVALVGPNGAGKTTVLRVLAGLGTALPGTRVVLDGTDVTAAPPPARRVGFVPHTAALFPHLTALGNVTYGLRSRGAGRRSAAAAGWDWLDRLGVAEVADRRAPELSAGQAQRVALARALAPRPRLLLLDEPLGALDAQTRTEVRRLLRVHLAAFDGACLLVTHDPVEAVTLADRIVVLEAGRVVQDGVPDEVTRRPRSRWVARLLGWNAWLGTTTREGLAVHGGHVLVAADPLPAGQPAIATVRPAAVAVHVGHPEGSPRNTWNGVVDEVTASGSRWRVHVAATPPVVAEVTPAAVRELALTEGRPVWVSVKATEVRVTPV
ncbi:MAG TPA: ABC transporter ATP-binding protein [Mycobacteriales bacterium]|nr:ABC transporter ATP-binding protein [Mycobacteriales bacterium]